LTSIRSRCARDPKGEKRPADVIGAAIIGKQHRQVRLRVSFALFGGAKNSLSKSERGDRHALAQGAGESQQQGLLWCGLGTDRVSGRVDRPAGFAFSRLN